MVLVRTYTYCGCGNPSTARGLRRTYISVPTAAAADSPCSQAEYNALRRELFQRNSQRDELLSEVMSLMEKNKAYKRGLEREERLRTSTVQALEHRQAVMKQEKEMLQSHLRLLLGELEAKEGDRGGEGGLDTEEQAPAGPEPSPSAESSGGGLQSPVQTARLPARLRPLVEQLQRLLQEKSQLSCQLSSLQCQLAASQEEGAGLEEEVARLKQDNAQLQQDLERLHRLPPASSEGSSVGTTDTEKQLEKIQVENSALQQEVDSLRSLALDSSVGYNPENQRMKLLGEENKRLKTQLETTRTALANKDNALRTLEAQHRQHTSRLDADHQKAARHSRALQYQITSLYAQEPQVLTRYQPVHVEVETKALHTALADAEVERAALTEELERCRKQLQEAQAKSRDLAASLTQQQEKVALLEAERDDLSEALQEAGQEEAARRELEESLQTQAALQASTASLASQCRHLVAAHAQLRQEAAALPKTIAQTVAAVRKELLDALQGLLEHNRELVRRYHKEMRLRKKFHNELVELKGNIRVFCRVRPVIREDGGSGGEEVISFDRDDDALLYLNNKGRTLTFEVDRVFPQSSTQSQVFDEVQALVTSCIDGYNVCIFAYGQTGSGKTHTMEGPPEDPGINQRALQELFRETGERGQDWHYTIAVSVLEIYNETIRDLLSEGQQQEKLEIKMHPEGGFHVPGLVSVPVSTVADVNRVFRLGHKNRATASTNMNEHSSRSHALLCVTVTGVNRTTLARSIGKLNLVDLAGSERVSKSGADGARLKEAQNINRSLACLGDVIHALRSKQNHVPFRNSRLTFLLQDSLGGDSKTLMIVQVAPVERHVAETACSLAFAQRVRSVELGAASRRVENGEGENGNRTPPASPGFSLSCSSPPSPNPSTPSRGGVPAKSGTPGRGPGTPSKAAAAGTPLGGLHRSASATTPLSRSTPLRSSRRK